MSYQEHPRQPSTELPVWQQLKEHNNSAKSFVMRDLFKADPTRFETFSASGAGLNLDYSKNLVTAETMQLLTQLAKDCHLQEAIEAMFSGETINRSEGRPVLHVALREQSDRIINVGGEDIMVSVRDTLAKMEQFCNRVNQGKWLGYKGQAVTDIVSIGIGGSFLGPMMVSEALTPYHRPNLRCHYVANVDSSDIVETLKSLNPETTLFVIASKSFKTQETLKNAETARQWFLSSDAKENDIAKHFVAVSTNLDAVSSFGIGMDNVFPMWDWVGGRYSLWSAIGLPLALTIGFDNFKALLKGAHSMDEHFRTTPLEKNLPVIMGMLGVWYHNFFDAQSHVVLPYDHFLKELPAHLQQLDMESNGKAVDLLGQALTTSSGPIIWGGVGTNGQHAYHQLLHQGTHVIPADFILPLSSHNPVSDHHALLAANCFAQSQAMMQGKTLDEAYQELISSGVAEEKAKELASHKVIPGNRPCNTLYFDKLTPEAIGATVALYEQKVFVQGIIWGINSFDQWGVELGKQLGDQIKPSLSGEEPSPEFDNSTLGLINAYNAINK